MVPITDLFAVRQALTLFANPVTIQSQNKSEQHYFHVLRYIWKLLFSFSPKSSSHEFLILIPFPFFFFLYVFLILLPGILQQTASCISAKKHLVHPLPCYGSGGLAPIMLLPFPALPSLACLSGKT